MIYAGNEIYNSLLEINFAKKKVFIRCDFNCPVNDYFKIECAIPTIKYIITQQCSHIILATHYGRPKSTNEYSTKHFLTILEKLLNTTIYFLPNGLNTNDSEISSPGIYLMENTCYHHYEESPTDNWNQLFTVDVFCNEAFSCSHRNHTSMTKIHAKENCLGKCFENEIQELNKFKTNENTMCKLKKMVILGGNKINEKLPMLRKLAKNIDVIFIAGNTLNHRESYANILNELHSYQATIILANDGFGKVDGNECQYIHNINTPNMDWIIKDVGPNTILQLQSIIDTMDLIFWNGTLGIVESPVYKRGSLLLLHALNHCKADVIICGGTTARFVKKYPNTLKHISTGDGASIHYLGE